MTHTTDNVDDDSEEESPTDDIDPVHLHRAALTGRPFTPPTPGAATPADAGIGGKTDPPTTDPLELHRQAMNPSPLRFRRGVDGYPIETR